MPSVATPVGGEEVKGTVTGEEKQMRCIETGSAVQWMEEENYKFRLSTFKTSLTDWLSTEPYGALIPCQYDTKLTAFDESSATAESDDSVTGISHRCQLDRSGRLVDITSIDASAVGNTRSKRRLANHLCLDRCPCQLSHRRRIPLVVNRANRQDRRNGLGIGGVQDCEIGEGASSEDSGS